MNQTHPIHENPFTSSAQVKVTTLSKQPTTKTPLPTHTDVPNRPVNSKTTLITTTAVATTSPSTTESPVATSTPDRPGFIPPFFPTFGVSGTTQAWIYGALVIIVCFIVGVALYLCVQKRKRRAKSSDYEFAVLEDEDDEGGVMAGSSSRRAGGAGGRRKARELYDAFGASDDEEMENYSDDEEKEYRDARDYELEQEEEARGIDEGERVLGGDREALLGRNRG